MWIESCSVIRVQENDLLADFAPPHAAILRRKDYDTWLRGNNLVQAKAALQPYNPAWMQAYAVSPRVNSTEAQTMRA